MNDLNEQLERINLALEDYEAEGGGLWVEENPNGRAVMIILYGVRLDRTIRGAHKIVTAEVTKK